MFPDFDPAKEIDEDEMKSKAGKEKWRAFMMTYEKTVDDYNFGTLLRRRADAEYEEVTTMFAPRMQVSGDDARVREGVGADGRWWCSSMLLRLHGTERVLTTGSGMRPRRMRPRRRRRRPLPLPQTRGVDKYNLFLMDLSPEVTLCQLNYGAFNNF